MKSDLRYAFRMIATHPWFSLVVILTLGLGIGANTTVFTLVNAVLFKPVPIPGGARLVTVNGQDLTRPENRRGVSVPSKTTVTDVGHSVNKLTFVPGAPGRTRTGTPLSGKRILSPLRLPIPPPGPAPGS